MKSFYLINLKFDKKAKMIRQLDWMRVARVIGRTSNRSQQDLCFFSSILFPLQANAVLVASPHSNQRIFTESKAERIRDPKQSVRQFQDFSSLQLSGEAWPTTVPAPRNSSTATASSTSPASTTSSRLSTSPPAASPTPSSPSWDRRVAVRLDPSLCSF